MSGRFFRRVISATLVVTALCFFPLTAGAAGAGASDEAATVQGSWNPLSFLMEYLSGLLPGSSEGLSEATDFSKAAASDTNTSNAGEGGSGDSGEDSDRGVSIDPAGTT